MNKRGFTLLELLVVVLIIGILASIALPQYQMAVGKSRLSELKIRTKAIDEAGHRYVLEHDGLPEDFDITDLDIEFPEDENITCSFYSTVQEDNPTSYISHCFRNILGVNVGYMMRNSAPLGCRVVFLDQPNHPAKKLCASDTGDENPSCGVNPNMGMCIYNY